MSQAHICNVFLEDELTSEKERPLSHWLETNSAINQLQFLPLLYAKPNDFILVSELPANPDPRLFRLDNPPQILQIEDWGPSRAIASWAKKHNIPYESPNWELIRRINSKVFSFCESPKLLGAELLQTEQELALWLKKTPGPKVLKTPFGMAGRGHFLDPKIETIPGNPDLSVKRLYTLPLIGEPWVERVLDFSTQWKNGTLLGITICENALNGGYQGTFVGEVENWALEEHLAIAEPLIQKIGQMGYLGHIGIDAFIYIHKGEKKLHPIVEINARKTMSWVALQREEKRLQFIKSSKGFLPSFLSKYSFRKNIT